MLHGKFLTFTEEFMQVYIQHYITLSAISFHFIKVHGFFVRFYNLSYVFLLQKLWFNTINYWKPTVSSHYSHIILENKIY